MRHAKEKPDAAGPAPSQSIVEDAPPTVARIEEMTREYDRTPLERVVDLANEMAENSGWYGEYQIHRPDAPYLPELEVWWYDGAQTDKVAWSEDGDELHIPDESEIDHELFVVCCDLSLHELPVCQVGEVAS